MIGSTERIPKEFICPEKAGILKDWSELRSDVQERLEQIREDIKALVNDLVQ